MFNHKQKNEFDFSWYVWMQGQEFLYNLYNSLREEEE